MRRKTEYEVWRKFSTDVSGTQWETDLTSAEAHAFVARNGPDFEVVKVTYEPIRKTASKARKVKRK